MQIRDRIKEFRRVAASEIRPNPKNWRMHSKEQQDVLRGVLSEIGIADALLARELPDGSLMLIDGHLRADFDPSAEWPVLILDVDESEADKLLATVDPLAAMAHSDTGKLDALLREVSTSDEAISKMLHDLGKDAGCEWSKITGEIVEDAIPEPPDVPVTQPGDLWLLGDHRLICGDSTDATVVDRLFSGGRASLLFTSPPYGQQRDYGKAKELVKNWQGLMEGVFQHCDRIIEPDGQVLVNLGLIHREGEWLPYWDAWIAWMRERGWRRFGWYVWDQGAGMPGDWNGRLAPSHEFIFHMNRKSQKPQKERECKYAGERHRGGGQRGADGIVGERYHGHAAIQPMAIFDSVIRVNRQLSRTGAGGHPAPFPVGLASIFIRSWPGLTYEPFAGSGTTLIAAEQLGRRCYACELEPAYCDIICQRFENLTGKKPTKEMLP